MPCDRCFWRNGQVLDHGSAGTAPSKLADGFHDLGFVEWLVDVFVDALCNGPVAERCQSLHGLTHGRKVAFEAFNVTWQALGGV